MNMLVESDETDLRAWIAWQIIKTEKGKKLNIAPVSIKQ
jgi:hypothetical protein